MYILMWVSAPFILFGIGYWLHWRVKKDISEFEAELLQDPEVRREYKKLIPKYDMIQKQIKRGKKDV